MLPDPAAQYNWRLKLNCWGQINDAESFHFCQSFHFEGFLYLRSDSDVMVERVMVYLIPLLAYLCLVYIMLLEHFTARSNLRD